MYASTYFIYDVLFTLHYEYSYWGIKVNFKKTIFISILLLVLSMAVVSASDLDNNYVTESDDSLVVEDSIVVSSEIQNSEILTASEGTFDDLQAEINFAPEGSVLNLTRDYNGQEDAIVHINKNLTIDGQGHTINCLKQCQAFTSEKGTITLKNLNIINGYVNSWRSEAYGGAIYVEGTTLLTIENCTFKDNWADDWVEQYM